MNSLKKRKSHYQKVDFSDEQIYNQIKDQIRDIQNNGLKQVEEETKILELYNTRKQQKKLKMRMQKSGKSDTNMLGNKGGIDSESDEPGEINEQQMPKRKQVQRQAQQKQISVILLLEHIKAITLTRDKIILCLDNRKFKDLVKGCFVRYSSDQKKSNNNSYVIAQIIDVIKSDKQYLLKEGSRATNVLLKLQQTSDKIVKLQLNMISNKAPGTLQFQNWIQVNRTRVIKQKQLREKLQQYNKLLSEQLSSQDIDNNIFKKAKAISEGKVQIKQDILHLIDFMHQKIDNLEVMQEEESSKKKQDKLQLIRIRRQRLQSKQILNKLIALNKKNNQKQQNLKKQMIQEKRERKKSIKFEYKRDDQINQKYKLKQLLLGTYEGFQKMKNKTLENHFNFDFDLEE